MGCDGGTIPKRDELVRTKKKPEQKDKQSELSFKWGHCAITQEPLQRPIVSCQLGRLFSKAAVIEALLDQALLPDAYNYIKSMRDVKELNLTENPAYKNYAAKGDSYIENVSPYICPVIGLEMNGKYRFVYFWQCGCVLSERALKAVPSKVCHKCQNPFIEEDIIVLNGNEEDLEIMKENMEDRQMRLRAERRERKKRVALMNEISAMDKSESASSREALMRKRKNRSQGPSKSIPSTSQSGSNKPNPNVEIQDPDFKKTKLNYSVAKDPNATEVFKSIFTSHKSAEKQEKAHWVTYNPFYN